jgi:hypothetical protein
MQITLDNRDTENIHIDTYAVLTGDRADEMTIVARENENRPADTPEYDYDSFDWTHNHKQIVEDFAKESIAIIWQAIANTDYAKIITNIEYIKSGSPKFYNYTTDWYTATYTVDEKELDIYAKRHTDGVMAIAKTYVPYHEQPSLEDIQRATLCHILNNCITADDYNMAMWEKETEIYYENTDYKLK